MAHDQHETDEQLRQKAREALYSKERATEDRLRSLETGRANIVRRLQALEAQNPKAECGCTGFFHASSCSDQNPIDPLGAILDPAHRQWVRVACEKYIRPPQFQKAEDPFEQALIDVANAVDSSGLKIRLFSGPTTVEALRKRTVEFGHIALAPVFVSPNPDPDLQLRAEANWWHNLALLAEATSKAIAFELSH